MPVPLPLQSVNLSKETISVTCAHSVSLMSIIVLQASGASPLVWKLFHASVFNLPSSLGRQAMWTGYTKACGCVSKDLASCFPNLQANAIPDCGWLWIELALCGDTKTAICVVSTS